MCFARRNRPTAQRVEINKERTRRQPSGAAEAAAPAPRILGAAVMGPQALLTAYAEAGDPAAPMMPKQILEAGQTLLSTLPPPLPGTAAAAAGTARAPVHLVFDRVTIRGFGPFLVSTPVLQALHCTYVWTVLSASPFIYLILIFPQFHDLPLRVLQVSATYAVYYMYLRLDRDINGIVMFVRRWPDALFVVHASGGSQLPTSRTRGTDRRRTHCRHGRQWRRCCCWWQQRCGQECSGDGATLGAVWGDRCAARG